MAAEVAVILIHGFLTAGTTWTRFSRLLRTDPALPGVDVCPFEYRSPLVSPHPLRRAATIDDTADRLRSFLHDRLADTPRLVLVSHSHGGLVVQRFLAQALAGGDLATIARIRLIVMYACPNPGADLALSRHRWGWLARHRQQRRLRPLREAALEAQRVVLRRVVHARHSPIKIRVYAGESDRMVRPESARSVFPSVGTLPGDHFSIVEPDSPTHRSYAVLKRDLVAVLSTPEVPPGMPAPGMQAPGMQAPGMPPPRMPAPRAPAPRRALGVPPPSGRRLRVPEPRPPAE